MRRKTARPYGQSVSGMRLVSMLLAMLVVWMLYDRLKDPATWRLIADDRENKITEQTETAKSPEVENLVPGPNDQDKDEMALAQKLLEVVRDDDKAPLREREMPAYWRMMDWSRTQPFDQLEKRAKNDVPFTQLWQQPEKYRGTLIRLRLHVRRVLEYDAPENTSNIAKIYEVWGSTDGSRSYPYVVVMPEAPNGLPIGTDVDAEIVFVGYFLKIMSYKAFDNARGAPLLAGRARFISANEADPPANNRKQEPLLLNIDSEGRVNAYGQKVDAEKHIRREARLLRDQLRVAGEPIQNNELPVQVIIRADRSAPFLLVNHVFKVCWDEGYREFSVNAKSGEEKK